MPDRPTTVAVLDDEDEMRTALTRLLRARGFSVTTFASGAEFIAASESSGFDCVVVDLQMPGLSGFGVLSELMRRPLRPAVVAITAHDVPGNRARVLALGAEEYLLKPVDQAVLLAAIQRALQAPGSRGQPP